LIALDPVAYWFVMGCGLTSLVWLLLFAFILSHDWAKSCMGWGKGLGEFEGRQRGLKCVWRDWYIYWNLILVDHLVGFGGSF